MVKVVRRNPNARTRGGWCGVGYLLEISSIAGLMLMVALLVTASVFPQQQNAAATEAAAVAPIYSLGFSGTQNVPWVNQLFTGLREFSVQDGRLVTEWPSYSRSLCDVARGGRDVVTTILADTAGKVRIMRGDRIVVEYDRVDQSNAVADVAVSEDGRNVVAILQRGRILEWNWDGTKFNFRTEQLNDHLDLVKFSPEGGRLLLGANSNQCVVWDRHARREVGRVITHERRVTQLQWLPDGRQFVTGGDDGFVRLWDEQTRAKIWEHQGDSLAPTSIAVSPDQREMAVGGFDNTIRIFSVEKGELLVSHEGHTGPIRGLAYDAEGRLLLSGDLKGNVLVWNREGRSILRKLL